MSFTGKIPSLPLISRRYEETESIPLVESSTYVPKTEQRRTGLFQVVGSIFKKVSSEKRPTTLQIRKRVQKTNDSPLIGGKQKSVHDISSKYIDGRGIRSTNSSEDLSSSFGSSASSLEHTFSALLQNDEETIHSPRTSSEILVTPRSQLGIKLSKTLIKNTITFVFLLSKIFEHVLLFEKQKVRPSVENKSIAKKDIAREFEERTVSTLSAYFKDFLRLILSEENISADVFHEIFSSMPVEVLNGAHYILAPKCEKIVTKTFLEASSISKEWTRRVLEMFIKGLEKSLRRYWEEQNNNQNVFREEDELLIDCLLSVDEAWKNEDSKLMLKNFLLSPFHCPEAVIAITEIEAYLKDIETHRKTIEQNVTDDEDDIQALQRRIEAFHLQHTISEKSGMSSHNKVKAFPSRKIPHVLQQAKRMSLVQKSCEELLERKEVLKDTLKKLNISISYLDALDRASNKEAFIEALSNICIHLKCTIETNYLKKIKPEPSTFMGSAFFCRLASDKGCSYLIPSSRLIQRLEERSASEQNGRLKSGATTIGASDQQETFKDYIYDNVSIIQDDSQREPFQVIEI